MSTAKSLTPEQIAAIQAWAERGDGLQDIQKALGSEFGIRVTYLETRFLLEDLKIELIRTPEPEEEKKPEAESAEADDETGADARLANVTIDALLKPGALVSGKVAFASGGSAAWWLDQYGRLGMDRPDPTFQPNEEELAAFQQELRIVLKKRGF
jgi:hypothetical protein